MIEYNSRSESYSFLPLMSLFFSYSIDHRVTFFMWLTLLLVHLTIITLVFTKYSVKKSDQEVYQQELSDSSSLSEEELVEQEYIQAKKRGGA